LSADVLREEFANLWLIIWMNKSGILHSAHPLPISVPCVQFWSDLCSQLSNPLQSQQRGGGGQGLTTTPVAVIDEHSYIEMTHSDSDLYNGHTSSLIAPSLHLRG
jgi:hypothetical protein